MPPRSRRKRGQWCHVYVFTVQYSNWMGKVCCLYLLNKDAQRVLERTPVFSCWEQWGQTAQQRQIASAFFTPFSFLAGKITHSQNHYFFPLNEKIVTANPSDCVSAAVILKRDSENCQMVAVDYSSIHLSSVLYHQSSDPDPHVGICSGEDDFLK